MNVDGRQRAEHHKTRKHGGRRIFLFIIIIHILIRARVNPCKTKQNGKKSLDYIYKGEETETSSSG